MLVSAHVGHLTHAYAPQHTRTWNIKVAIPHGRHNGALCNEQSALGGSLLIVRLHVWLRDIAHCTITGEWGKHHPVLEGVGAKLDGGKQGVGGGGTIASGTELRLVWVVDVVIQR